VVGHYRGKIFAWDVVNEAFDEIAARELRSTIWRDQAGIGLAKNGSSHIERCFRWAHEADPRALLFYTDAEAEAVNPKSDAIYAMVRDFRRRGAPIDGVGLQMHIATCTPMFASISENIKRRSACRCTSRRWTPRCRSMRWADIWSEIVATCLAHPGCTAIQTRGATDKYSWNSRKTEGAAI
jgi:endo-1,4-beta-xylanase